MVKFKDILTESYMTDEIDKQLNDVETDIWASLKKMKALHIEPDLEQEYKILIDNLSEALSDISEFRSIRNTHNKS